VSSRRTAELHNPEVGDGAMLVVAQMPTELLQQLATRLGVTFTPSMESTRMFSVQRYTIPTRRINLDLFTIIRNKLWFQYGVLTTIGVLERVLDPQDMAAGQWKKAAAETVRRLERKAGHISDDDCAICRQVTERYSDELCSPLPLLLC
jgi:hypothetical protein